MCLRGSLVLDRSKILRLILALAFIASALVASNSRAGCERRSEQRSRLSTIRFTRATCWR